MKVTRVTVESLKNTGNYENEKIGLSATVEDDEDVKAVVNSLRGKIADAQKDLVTHRSAR